MIVNLPNVVDLQSHLDRLEADLGRVILLAIEQPEVCNFARCTGAGLNREERKTLKIALENARQKRAQSGSRNVCGMIDELTAQKCRARYFARKAALCVSVARRKPRNPKAIAGTSLRKNGPIMRTRWKDQNIWRNDGKFVHRNCEQCRSEFWAKMPWARFCSTTCRVLSAYHKKRIRRCIQPADQQFGI